MTVDGEVTLMNVTQGTSRTVPVLLLIIAFLSGVPTLIYEIIWLYMLVNFLGSSIYAVSITTALFMLGFALGAYFFGNYADRVARYLRLYALLQICIGLSALGISPAVAILKTNKFGLFQLDYYHLTLMTTQRIAISSLFFMVPTFFIGGTLPVLSKLIRRIPSAAGEMLGKIYCFNILGSISGCMLAVSVMIWYFGLGRSLFIAAATNILIGCACFFWDRIQTAPILPRDSLNEWLPIENRVVLLALGISGFTALCYEIIWTRILIFWLRDTTLSFGIILSVFLGCLALGSFFCAQIIDNLSAKKLRSLFSWLQVFISVAAASSIYLHAMAIQRFLKMDVDWGIGVGLLITFVTFFGVAFFFGLSFPVGLKILSQENPGYTRDIGLGYAVNTAGSMFGSLVAGLILIPWLGVQKSICLVATLNIAVFILLFATNNIKGIKLSKHIPAMAFCVGIVVALQVVIPKHYLENVMSAKIKNGVIFFKEGADATVIVSKEPLALWINGLINAIPGMRMQHRAHIPLLLSAHPRDVLVIGFGSGTTLGIVTELYGIKADCVEISKSVIEAGRFFSEVNYDVLNSRNANIIIMDAGNFVEFTNKRYDVIIVDTSKPYITNSNRLFSREFYTHCLGILKDGGIMVQWLPYHVLTKEDARTMIKTFIGVFDDAYLLRENNIIGFRNQFHMDKNMIKLRLSASPKIKRDLKLAGINNVEDLLDLFIADKKRLIDFANGASVITEDRPYFEFSVFRYGVFKEYNRKTAFSEEDIL